MSKASAYKEVEVDCCCVYAQRYADVSGPLLSADSPDCACFSMLPSRPGFPCAFPRQAQCQARRKANQITHASNRPAVTQSPQSWAGLDFRVEVGPKRCKRSGVACTIASCGGCGQHVQCSAACMPPGRALQLHLRSSCVSSVGTLNAGVVSRALSVACMPTQLA